MKKSFTYVVLFSCAIALLTGCLTAKVSHSSEAKVNVVSDNSVKADSNISTHLELHERETKIDTTAILKGFKSDFKTVLIKDTVYLHDHADAAPIHFTKHFGKATLKGIFFPATGELDGTLNVPSDTVIITADVKEKTVVDNRQRKTDVVADKNSTVKTDVKGITSVSVSLFSTTIFWKIIAVIALLIGIVIGRHTKK